MLQFRAHWLGQQTIKQFKKDFASCMWLTKFTHLFFVARFLNADPEQIDNRGEWDVIRAKVDLYRKRGATLDEFRIVQSELLADVLVLIDQDVTYKDRDNLLFAIVNRVNAMQLAAKWELQSGLPHRVSFQFPPLATLSTERSDVLGDFYNQLSVLGAGWGLKNAPKEVKIAQTKNPNPFLLSRGQSVLKLHGGRWIVKRHFFTANDIRQDIYSSLITSLEDGSFSRLHRCPYCSIFFTEEVGQQGYCSKECSLAFTNADTKNRVREYRKRLKERREQVDSKAYWERLRRAEETDRKGDLLSIYKKFGGPQEGRKFIRNKSWNALSRQTQTKILEISKEHPL